MAKWRLDTSGTGVEKASILSGAEKDFPNKGGCKN